MGITDFFADLYSSVVTQDVVAEAPKADTGDEHQSGESDSKAEEEPEEEPQEEEEEEEEEEPEDPKPQIEEECANSKECSPAKHHYDECVERVTKQIDDNGKADEDCVEEFFHLAHCATQCAAPKLFAQLK